MPNMEFLTRLPVLSCAPFLTSKDRTSYAMPITWRMVTSQAHLQRRRGILREVNTLCIQLHYKDISKRAVDSLVVHTKSSEDLTTASLRLFKYFDSSSEVKFGEGRPLNAAKDKRRSREERCQSKSTNYLYVTCVISIITCAYVGSATEKLLLAAT